MVLYLKTLWHCHLLFFHHRLVSTIILLLKTICVSAAFRYELFLLCNFTITTTKRLTDVCSLSFEYDRQEVFSVGIPVPYSFECVMYLSMFIFMYRACVTSWSQYYPSYILSPSLWSPVPAKIFDVKVYYFSHFPGIASIPGDMGYLAYNLV